MNLLDAIEKANYSRDRILDMIVMVQDCGLDEDTVKIMQDIQEEAKNIIDILTGEIVIKNNSDVPNTDVPNTDVPNTDTYETRGSNTDTVKLSDLDLNDMIATITEDGVITPRIVRYVTDEDSKYTWYLCRKLNGGYVSTSTIVDLEGITHEEDDENEE